MRRLEAQAVTRHETLAQRLDGLEQALRAHVDQAGNSLAAFIGELDDRVERMEAARGLAPPRA
jgi:hypothetical protein